MLAGGFAPCLPAWPIKKIKLQGRHAGFNTDDLIVFANEPNGSREAKLLAQIKRSIDITKQDRTFGEVIRAAWNDFRDPTLFTPGTDAIALITGPLSVADVRDTRTILEWARHSEDANEFIGNVDRTFFSSPQKRAKLQAFRAHLRNANDGTDVSDDDLWKFMRCYHLLGYDLDIKLGVTVSLLHTLISHCSAADPHSLWSKMIVEVQSANRNAGTLTAETLSLDLREAFRKPTVRTIPEVLVTAGDVAVTPALASARYSTETAVAGLVGSWVESSDHDRSVIEELSATPYRAWIGRVREDLFQTGTLLRLIDGRWSFTDRHKAWTTLGPHLFDEHIDRFRKIAISTLTERDPRFELPPDKRYAASIVGKVLLHSTFLRKGIAESLALLGSCPKALTSCSFGRAEATACRVVREVLANSDWVLWASLNDLLPLLAESAPTEFLDAAESAMNDDQCPYDAIFAQESPGIFGGNYMTGLLWALETLAWDPQYLTRVVIILGALARRDPGGNWGNRPANSLTTILLPWLPQTCAPVANRKTAVELLIREAPHIAWSLLLCLLPKSHQVSSGSRKPLWRELIPEGRPAEVTPEEYREQVTAYAELAVGMAERDRSRLAGLIDHLNNLPESTREQLLTYLESSEILSLSEEGRLPLWTELVNLVSKHRKYRNANWAMGPEQVSRVAGVAERLAPATPIYRHRRLFTQRDADLWEERGNYEEQQKELERRRRSAVGEIFAGGGVTAVLGFAESVESPSCAGLAFGAVAPSTADREVLPRLLTTPARSLAQFAEGYVRGRFVAQGWQWVDEIDMSGWLPTQKGQLLAHLPFVHDAWGRVSRLLGDAESSYWTKTDAVCWGNENGLESAVDRLAQYGRPRAAIRCLAAMSQRKQRVHAEQAVRVLLGAVNSEESPYAMDAYDAIEVIKALQDDPDASPDDLVQVEWAYLPLLDEYNDASPELLEQRLANDPAFFCEVIRAVFRAEGQAPPPQEPTEQERSLAANAYQLLRGWRTPPGSQKGGLFDGGALSTWLKEVRRSCAESGHLEVAMKRAGHVLRYAPPDPGGLWIHSSVAAALDAPDANDMRDGFVAELFESRGVYECTGGREEREIAKKYRVQAEEVERCGYHRLADSLRRLAAGYEHEADREEREDASDD
jgi:hypothetical protein